MARSASATLQLRIVTLERIRLSAFVPGLALVLGLLGAALAVATPATSPARSHAPTADSLPTSRPEALAVDALEPGAASLVPLGLGGGGAGR